MLTLQQHAQKALRVQDACNLHGVAVSLQGWLDDYAALFPAYSTDEKNQHPITVLYVDKLAHLAGCQSLGHEAVMRAYTEVHKIVKQEAPHAA